MVADLRLEPATAGAQRGIPRDLTISTFLRAEDNVPHRVPLTWPELAEKLTHHDERRAKDGPLFSPAIYRSGALRANENVEALTLLVGDFDHDVDWETFRDWVAEYEYIAYSTWRYTPEEPRFRVAIPLTRAVEANHWPNFWQRANAHIFRGTNDRSTRDASRMYYLPACPREALRFAERHEGRALDPDALPPVMEDARNGHAAPLPDRIATGQRNAMLTSLAGSMRRRGASEAAILAALLEVNSSQCDPPLGDAEVQAIAGSVAHYPPADATAYGNASATSAYKYPLTDLGNAERLVARHGADLRHCHPWGAWLHWDGQRWARDVTGEVERRAKLTVRAIYSEAQAEPDAERRKALASWAARSESEARIAAMIALSRSEPSIPVSPAELDRDQWLLNVSNGTLNLRTAQLREHRRDDYITMLAQVDYDPDATAPTWDGFLAKVQPHEEMRTFLQRVTGYGATGDVSEQCIVLHYGSGANGKSTFSACCLEALGDYARQAAPDLLTLSRDERHPTEIADLAGVRYVASTEVEEGRRLAEVAVKQMTGGDRMKARFMHHDFFEFTPTHKVFLAANHKPVIRGTDYAIWRRIRLVPWTVTIPDEEQDKRLPEKLRAELPGILRWIVQGCLEWQRDGLQVPEAVRSATAAYRGEMDPLAGFIEDRCVLAANAYATTRELYGAYVDWCERNGERPVSKRAAALRLTERGFDQARLGAKQDRGWLGIGLKASMSDTTDTTDTDVGYDLKQSDSRRANPLFVSVVSGVCDKTPADPSPWSEVE